MLFPCSEVGLCINFSFMKRIFHPSLLIVFAILSIASMCEDDEMEVNPSSVGATLAYGSWQVVYFFDKQDETSDFDGYVFQFQEGGAVLSTKSGLTVQGTWSTEDSSNGNKKLYLDFGPTSPLDELNEDWIVTEHKGTRIGLEHESGGNGDIDKLVFERK